MTPQYCDTFAAPPRQARAAAITLVGRALCHDPTKVRAVAGFGELVHASLQLCRALAARLRTPAAMALITGWFLEAAADDIPDDPDRRLAAALVAAHLQTAPVLPDDDAGIALHNFGVQNFNDACDALDEAERYTEVLVRVAQLWAHLLPEANGLAGVAVLNDVASELWGEPREEPTDG